MFQPNSTGFAKEAEIRTNQKGFSKTWLALAMSAKDVTIGEALVLEAAFLKDHFSNLGVFVDVNGDDWDGWIEVTANIDESHVERAAEILRHVFPLRSYGKYYQDNGKDILGFSLNSQMLHLSLTGAIPRDLQGYPGVTVHTIGIAGKDYIVRKGPCKNESSNQFETEDLKPYFGDTFLCPID